MHILTVLLITALFGWTAILPGTSASASQTESVSSDVEVTEYLKEEGIEQDYKDAEITEEEGVAEEEEEGVAEEEEPVEEEHPEPERAE